MENFSDYLKRVTTGPLIDIYHGYKELDQTAPYVRFDQIPGADWQEIMKKYNETGIQFVPARYDKKCFKIKPFVAWYDCWIGLYWDRKKKWLYFLPLPCVGLKIKFRDKN